MALRSSRMRAARALAGIAAAYGVAATGTYFALTLPARYDAQVGVLDRKVTSELSAAIRDGNMQVASAAEHLAAQHGIDTGGDGHAKSRDLEASSLADSVVAAVPGPSIYKVYRFSAQDTRIFDLATHGNFGRLVADKGNIAYKDGTDAAVGIGLISFTAGTYGLVRTSLNGWTEKGIFGDEKKHRPGAMREWIESVRGAAWNYKRLQR